MCVPGFLLLVVGAEEAEGGPAAAHARGDAAVLLRRVHTGLHRALLVIRHAVSGHPEHLPRLTPLHTDHCSTATLFILR